MKIKYGSYLTMTNYMATFNSYKDTLTIPEDVDIRLSIMLVVIQSILFFVFYKYQLRVGNSYDRRRYKFY